MATVPTAPARDLVAAELGRARRATLTLAEVLDTERLTRQVSPLMSPLVWDMAHIAHFEELWLLRRLGHSGPTDPRFDDIYDAFAHGRDERASLPLLTPGEARAYMADVRGRVLDRLAHAAFDEDDPLLAAGFVHGMVVQHELQHVETMLQTLQLAGWPVDTPAHGPGDPPPAVETVPVPAGAAVLGTDDAPWAYDNERPAHEVHVEAFLIERHPVTNARYAEFIADGGYRRPELWSAAGWAWRCAEDADAPLYWRRCDGGWLRTRFGREEAPPPGEPVQHVSFHEAEAFANWAGRRLPTEAEWERAAAGAGPCPDDNLGRDGWGPRAVRSAEEGPCALFGDVWEWTSSPFTAYPGFRAFPYREYSEVFFGDAYRVLRGGSWATDPLVARATFRNWDLPQRRQIFSGIRLVEDA